MERLFHPSKNESRRTVQRGAAAVEFALVVPILALIVAGIVEFGRALWYYDALAKATRDGARYMSTAPKLVVYNTAMTTAKTMVVDEANAANVSPVLTAANVQVTCLDAAFQPFGCNDAAPPINVRVEIINYNVTVGGWMSFVLPSGGVASFTPRSTMRYMCSENSTTICF